jgi:hypothetical protein
MAFTEDLDLFLNTDEMAVPVTAGSVSGNGILDMPSETIAGGMVVSTDYSLICRADQFGDLMHGAGINVDGYPYTLIGPPMLLDDGAFCSLTLQRTVTPEQNTSDDTVLDGDGVSTTSTVELSGGAADTAYIEGNVLDSGGA